MTDQHRMEKYKRKKSLFEIIWSEKHEFDEKYIFHGAIFEVIA